MKRKFAILICILLLFTTIAAMPAFAKKSKQKDQQTYIQSSDPQPEKMAAESDCTVAVGERTQVTFMVYPLDAASVYRYKSSKSSVASVSADGTITGMKQGSAVITVTAENGVSCKINVNVCPYCTAHEDVAIFAHRGASGNYPPGNSLEAFSHAKELGATAIELDIQQSSDGVIFVRHDPTLRYRGKKKKVSTLTYDVITAQDKNVCTLREALDCIHRYDLSVEIEFKVAGIEQETLDIVKACDMTDKVLYGSFDLDVIDKVKELDPQAVTVYILNSSKKLSKVVKNPSAYSCDIVSASYSLLTTKNIRDLHLGGKKVSVWTVNTSGRIGAAIAKGVDAVITDYPQLV